MASFFFSDDNTETVGGETQKDDPQAVTEGDAEGGEQAAEVEDEWEIQYSDEEMEDPKNWMPPPSEIKRLYEILAKGEMLELNFVPLPRRPPTPERTPSPERDEEEDAAKERERLEKERKSVELLCSTSSILNYFDSFVIDSFYFPDRRRRLSSTSARSKLKPLRKTPSSTGAEHQVGPQILPKSSMNAETLLKLAKEADTENLKLKEAEHYKLKDNTS